MQTKPKLKVKLRVFCPFSELVMIGAQKLKQLVGNVAEHRLLGCRKINQQGASIG